jgi:hypothetical protein
VQKSVPAEPTFNEGFYHSGERLEGYTCAVRNLSVTQKIVTPMVLILAGVGIYYYRAKMNDERANQEFVVTGEILHKNGTKVQPVAGADITIYAHAFEREGSYLRILPLVRERQLILHLWHPGSPGLAEKDARFAVLQLSPLAKMDRIWWNDESLINCSFGARRFWESFRYVTSTSADMKGDFWVKLKRGSYIIFAESEVQTSIDYGGRTQSATGWAFWDIPITVTGDMKVVSASASCSPD